MIHFCEKGFPDMIEFGRMFLSYLVLMLVIVVVAAIGFTIGMFLRKMKNKKNVEVIDSVE